MEDEDENAIQKKNTIKKIEINLKKQNEKYQKEKEEKKNKPEKIVDLKSEKLLYRKSISIKKPIIDKDKMGYKITNIINNYLEKHQMKQYEKIPDYVAEKEDDSVLIKQCNKFDINDDNYLPIIVIPDVFYDNILDFIDKYIKYNEYNHILNLKNKLLVPMKKINNYNIFHKEKSNEEEYNSLVAETISSTLINLYDKNEINNIKNNIKITSKEFKDNFSYYIKKWVTTVYDIISDYILFKLKEKPLYYLCPKCEMPILYKENKIENDKNSVNQINEENIINENNNNNIINENSIENKEKIIQKRIEKKKKKEKLLMDKIKNDDNEKIKFKSLFNIANTIIDLINFNCDNFCDMEKNSFLNIANPPPKSNNTGNEKHEKNLIYYDENKHTNYELFERQVSGAFIFISDEKILNVIMDYLNSKSIIKYFILIVNGKNCEKIFENLNNKNYLNLFESCCLLTTNKKYDYLSNKYTKAINIYKTKKDLIQYIKDYDNIKLIYSVKLVNYKKYSDTYHKFYEKISSFYGDFSPDQYGYSISLFNEFVNEPGSNIPISLLEDFKKFQDSEKHKVEIVKFYTDNNSYYPLFNKWLYELDFIAYDKTSYFMSGLMYCLNLFGNEQKNQTSELKLYRGMRLDIITLLPYKNCEGKLIVFASFTSTSIDLAPAKDFSFRNKSTEYRKNMGIYSVIFYINFNLKSNWFPNGIDVHGLSLYGYEKEILFQPFTFFKITKVDIDFDNNTADINLEVIGRKEVLEEKVKEGKMITYNEKEGIMEIVN